MKRLLTFFLFNFLVMNANADHFETETIHSKINQKTYTLFYHLPSNHENAQVDFPVVYVLNCEWIWTSYIQELKRQGKDQKVILIGVGYGRGPGYKMKHELEDYAVSISEKGIEFTPFREVFLNEIVDYTCDKLPINRGSVTVYGNAAQSQFTTALALEGENRIQHVMVSNLFTKGMQEDDLIRFKEKEKTNNFLLLNQADNRKKYGEDYDQLAKLLHGRSVYYEMESDFPSFATCMPFGLGISMLDLKTSERSTQKSVSFEYRVELTPMNSSAVQDSFLIYSYTSTNDRTKEKDLIVLLDADLDFIAQVRIGDGLMKAGEIGDFAIVSAGTGIDLGNYGDKRFRDLMFSRVRGYSVSGGGENHLKLLEGELLEKARQLVGRINRKVLCGHSLGGSFTAYAASTEHPKFDAYLVSSPAFWVEKKTFKNLMKSIPNEAAPADIFVSVGANEGKRTKMVKNALKYKDELQPKMGNRKLKSMVYEGHNHESVVPVAFRDGIRFLLGND